MTTAEKNQGGLPPPNLKIKEDYARFIDMLAPERGLETETQVALQALNDLLKGGNRLPARLVEGIDTNGDPDFYPGSLQIHQNHIGEFIRRVEGYAFES
jgi:hypothetical protein